MNSLLSFFDSILCGRHTTKNARLVNEVRQLQLDLEQSVSDLERFASEISDLEYMVSAHELEGDRLRDEKALLEWRIVTLEKWLDESIQIPDIDRYVVDDELVTYVPWTHPEVWRNYEMSTADLNYYALPQEAWDEILPRIQAVVAKHLETWRPEIADCVIPSELGWALGLFLADGSCGFRENKISGEGAWWRITNTNTDYLKRAKTAFEDYFKDDSVTFKIVSFQSEQKGSKTNYGKRNKSLYHLEVNSGKTRDKKGKYSGNTRKKFIEKFRNDFYLFGEKKIPACLWDKGNRLPKLEFMRGFYAGDGNKGKGSKCAYVKSQSAVIGLIECMINIGWKYKIRPHRGGFNIYMNWQNEHIPFIADKVWKEKEISFKELEKWMIENFGRHSLPRAINKLENGGYIKRKLRRTSSGRPQIIQAVTPYPEACDDWALAMQSFVMIAFARLWPRIWLQGAFLTTWSRTHAYNAYVTDDSVIHIYEPQTGQTVGELDITGPPYDTMKIWYPGAKNGKDSTPNVDGP